MTLVQTIRGYKIFALTSGNYGVEDPSGRPLGGFFPTFQDAKRAVVRRL